MIDNINSFRDTIQQDGMTPPEHIEPGRIHRFPGAGKGKGNIAGWCKMFPDGLGGVYGDYSRELSETWQADRCKTFTPAERSAFNKQVEESRKQAEESRKKYHADAALKAVAIYENAKEDPARHQYYIKKGVNLGGLVRCGVWPQRGWDNALIIPIYDSAEDIVSLQAINTDGTKDFLSGGRIKGCFYPIGKIRGATGLIVIGEGVGTVAPACEVMGCPGVCALSDGNLEAVTKEIRKLAPDAEIIIIADDDQKEDGSNPGRESATKAAEAIGCKWVIPDLGKKADAWDVFNELGAEGIRAMMAAAVFPGCKEPETVSGLSDDKAIIQNLAALSPLDYDRTRIATAKALNVRPATLDTMVRAARKEEQTESGLVFDDLEPWPDPVDGATLLSEIALTVHRFIVCQSETAYAVALWAAMTWFMDVVQVAPLAVITAPEKRCGKSQLLFLLSRLVYRPLTASNISTAALFRTIDALRPTMLVDEADSFMKENEDMRGLLNSGHTRDGAYIIRVVGDDHEPKRFNTWGAKALAGIGRIADTLMDRAVVLELRRKLPHEQVERLRYAEPGLFDTLAAQLCRFAEDNQEAVRLSRPDLPGKLNDRAQDNWEPLLAIADVVGGQWPALARDAALKLSGAVDPGLTIGTELLSDIQEIFESKKVDRISSVDLIAALCEDEEKPWATYNHGFQIKPRQVAKRLSEYGISSNTIRVNGTTAKGFTRPQFEDAFVRYLTLSPVSSVTPSQALPVKVLGVTDSVTRYGNKIQKVTREPLILKGCDGVTDKTPLKELFTQKEDEPFMVTI